MTKLIKTIATVFGIGYLPLAPGTFAALAGLILYIFSHNYEFIYNVETQNFVSLHYYITTAFILAIGFLVSGRAERIFGQKDSRNIVIDDFAGVFIVYLFIPFKLPYILTGFILYRFFDIIKIYPIKKIESLPGGWGIMLDDIAAGIYANVVLQIISRIV